MYIISCFSIAAFKSLSLYIAFENLIFSVDTSLFNLFVVLWNSSIWIFVSHSTLGNFSVIISLNNSSTRFSFSAPIGTPIVYILLYHLAFHKSHENEDFLCSFLFFFFFFAFCSSD